MLGQPLLLSTSPLFDELLFLIYVQTKVTRLNQAPVIFELRIEDNNQTDHHTH